MTEGELMRRIQEVLCRSDTRVRMWRNNVGMAWTGKKIVRNVNGTLTIYDPHPVKFGLCNGSADLIGPTPYTVTPEDVGKTLAIFTAIEVKTARGKAALIQKRFLAVVRSLGGRARVCRNNSEALGVLTEIPGMALDDDNGVGAHERNRKADSLVATRDSFSQDDSDGDSEEAKG